MRRISLFFFVDFLPRASNSRIAVLWLCCRTHPLPGQMLQHLQLTAEQGATAGTGRRVHLIGHPFPSSHSLTPVSEKGQAKRDAQPEIPERGQRRY